MAAQSADAPCTERPQWVRKTPDGWHLHIRVQPGAKKSETAGEMDGRLRVRICAQAVDNKANKALMAFIAKELGIRANKVCITAGETSRQKTLYIVDEHEPNWGALRSPDSA